MKENNNLLIATSPQIHHSDSTARVMWSVSLCLLPAALWGIYVFGMKSLFVLLMSIAAALVTEWVLNLIMKRDNTLPDGSAFLTGLLIGFNMPPAVPGFIPVIASVVAIAVVKYSFGGLGGNWMNPALAGRAIVFFSWTGPMSTWSAPLTNSGIDALSGASPLGLSKTNLMAVNKVVSGPLELIQNYPQSSFATQASQWLEANLGLHLDSRYIDFFFGNVSGSIGEVSAFLLLLGAIYLLWKKIITWDIPVAYLGSFMLLVWIFGGFNYGQGVFKGDVLFHIFAGGIILGALFMATDMVTSPLTPKGRLIFGLGCGFLTYLIRFYGSFPEGVSLAIIIMNFTVPLIDRYTGPVRFGLAKKGQEA